MGEMKKMRPGRQNMTPEYQEELDDDERLAEQLLNGEIHDTEPYDGEFPGGGQEQPYAGEAGTEEADAEDLYRVYMEEIAAIPPCSPEENTALLARVKKGDGEARNRLIEGNLKQALLYVSQYINQGVPMVDLIQEASMELMLLADEGFEDGFEKLLESRIRVRMEEVVKEQKSASEIEEEVLARVNVLQEVSRRMAEELGREATLAELSERMKMPEEEVKEIMKVTMDALSLSQANRSLQS